MSDTAPRIRSSSDMVKFMFRNGLWFENTLLETNLRSSLPADQCQLDLDISPSPLFQWYACNLAKLSAYIAKCITTLNKVYIVLFFFTM